MTLLDYGHSRGVHFDTFGSNPTLNRVLSLDVDDLPEACAEVIDRTASLLDVLSWQANPRVVVGACLRQCCLIAEELARS